MFRWIDPEFETDNRQKTPVKVPQDHQQSPSKMGNTMANNPPGQQPQQQPNSNSPQQTNTGTMATLFLFKI